MAYTSLGSSSSLNSDSENQENVKSRSDKGNHAVPPSDTGNYIPPKPDLMFIDEQVKSESVDVVSNVTSSAVKTVELKVESVDVKNKRVYSTVETKPVKKNNFSPPIIKDWNSNDKSEVEFKPKVEVKTVRPCIEKIKFVKTDREKVEKSSLAVETINNSSNFNNTKKSFNPNSPVNAVFTPVSAAGSTYINLGGSIPVNVATLPNVDLPTDPLMPNLEDIMDVKSAFLYDTIKEEVYVCQPPGFEDPHFPNKVYMVEKALYGLHQAPRAWINGQEVSDEIYRELTFFLGLQVMQKDDGIFISQDKYMADILKKIDFSLVKTPSTPIKTNKALLKDEEAKDVDVHLYRSMIRSLMYLTTSRPDIMFVVCACVRFQVTPKVSHLYAVKRIFRYLKGQPKLGLWYLRDSPFVLEAFTNSDYAGASLDKKSIIGGCQFLRKRLISCQCKKQTIVANLTTKAEYVTTANYYGQFWTTTKSKIVNDVKQIHAIVDGKIVVITDPSVRSDLHFNDKDGITCLSNDEIFQNLALMGGQDIKIPQSSVPPKKVGDEAVYTGEDDRIVALESWTIQERRKILDKSSVSKQERSLMIKIEEGDFDDIDDMVDRAMEIVEGDTVNAAIGVSAASASVLLLVYLLMRSEKAKEKGVVFSNVEESEFDDVQARVDADALLAEKFQEEETKQFSIDEQARFFVEIIAERKSFTYNQLKNKSLEEIQKLYEKEQKWINDFVPMESKVLKDSGKKDDSSQNQAESTKKIPRAEHDEESVKKQKLEDDTKKEKLRACLDIVLGDDFAINVESLATKYPIVNWKTQIITKSMMYYQIIKANRNSKNYKIFTEMCDDFDRHDVLDLYRLVKQR
nr:uncharacterized mitochondrial protein AtMg00810-like [Tanacetum cinerariifolium]